MGRKPLHEPEPVKPRTFTSAEINEYVPKDILKVYTERGTRQSIAEIVYDSVKKVGRNYTGRICLAAWEALVQASMERRVLTSEDFAALQQATRRAVSDIWKTSKGTRKGATTSRASTIRVEEAQTHMDTRSNVGE